VAAERDHADVAAMLRLQNGDDLALNEIMERWQKRVANYLIRLTGDQTVRAILRKRLLYRSIKAGAATGPKGPSPPGYLPSRRTSSEIRLAGNIGIPLCRWMPWIIPMISRSAIGWSIPGQSR